MRALFGMKIIVQPWSIAPALLRGGMQSPTGKDFFVLCRGNKLIVYVDTGKHDETASPLESQDNARDTTV
jgi:hypothetical protein